MATNNSIVAEAILEDKLADIWPDYPCLYDVRSPEFKNRDLRDKAFQEIAEKLGTTCKILSLNFSFLGAVNNFILDNSHLITMFYNARHSNLPEQV